MFRQVDNDNFSLYYVKDSCTLGYKYVSIKRFFFVIDLKRATMRPVGHIYWINLSDWSE